MKKTYLKRKPGTGVKKTSTLRRKPLKTAPGSTEKAKARKAVAKKKKKRTVADLWREWFVPDNAYRRYTGLRGIYWYWLSREVRKDEWEKYDGLCITCLLPIEHWTQGHCGHIIAAQNCGEYLRFNRINLSIQHPACNSDRITPQAAALNALHYDQRHGIGAWDALYSLRKTEAKCPTQPQYRELIEALSSYKEAKNKAILETGDNSLPDTTPEV